LAGVEEERSGRKKGVAGRKECGRKECGREKRVKGEKSEGRKEWREKGVKGERSVTGERNGRREWKGKEWKEGVEGKGVEGGRHQRMLSLESIKMRELLVGRGKGLGVLQPLNRFNGTEQIKVNHGQMLCQFNSGCFCECVSVRVCKCVWECVRECVREWRMRENVWEMLSERMW
jgi:hypothetical protein